MMPDLNDLLRRADRMPVPDLWAEIRDRRPRSTSGPSSGRRLLVAALALAVAGAGIAVAVRAFTDDRSPRPAASPVPVDPRVTAQIRVGPFPRGIAAGLESAWVGVPNQGQCGGEVVRIAQSTNEITARIPVEMYPNNIAVGFGAVWVQGDFCSDGKPGGLLRIDPATSRVTATIDIGFGTSDVAVGEGAVWVSGFAAFRTGRVFRVDPESNAVTDQVPVDGWPADIFTGAGGVWVVQQIPEGAPGSSGYELLQVDAATGRVVGRVPDVLAAGAGEGYAWASVWVERYESGLVRIDPQTTEIIGAPIPRDFRGFAGEHGTLGTFPVGEGGVWFWAFPDRSASSARGQARIYRLNAATLEEDASVELNPARDWIDAALDPGTHTLWISHYRDLVTRIDLVS
ncbi:MAG: hypothetical protein ACRDI0_03030 [Actinomycetota bacterium]